MRNSKKIWLFLSAFFALSFVCAQQVRKENTPDQYRPILWDADDGLPYGQSSVVIKDAKGFLWIGSSMGLFCRFDGSNFKKYISDANRARQLNSDRIYGFTRDSLNNIWIGTDLGLSRYDVKADTFTNFPLGIDSLRINDPNFHILPSFPFWATGTEVYCLEWGFRIVSYDIYSLKRKTQFVHLGPERIFPKYAILDTVSNCVWIQCGISRNPDLGGLLKISLTDGNAKPYTWPCTRKGINHGHGSENIKYDRKRKSIWINSGDGLWEFSLGDESWHFIDALAEFVKRNDYERYCGIDLDLYGRVWLATKPKGILIYDPETQKVSQLFSNPELQHKTGESNLHIYCDPEGVTWASYWSSQGIYQFLPYSPPVIRYKAKPSNKDSLSSGMISTIIQGPQGKLWIGTSDGLNIYDPGSETFEVLREKDLPGIKGTAIIPLYVDTIRQKAWLNAGSQETYDEYFGMRLYEMDVNTMQCKSIVFRDKSIPIEKWAVSHTLVTPYKDGLLVWDEYHGLFEVKPGRLDADLIIPFIQGIGAFTLVDHRYMFLKNGAPVLPNFTFENIDGKWVRRPHVFDSLVWTFILYNKKDQSYWVSLSSELIHFNKDFRKIKTYRSEEGYNGYILNMLMDKAGNIWFVNFAKQLGRLDPSTGTFTILSESEGYNKQDYTWFVPLTMGLNGDLYSGIGWKTGVGDSQWGLYRVYPERFAPVNSAAVYIQSLIVNQKPFALSTEVNSLNELFLRYNQNTFRIETGIIDFYSKTKGHIRYKLEENGKETEWIYPSDYYVRYEGLTPGSYKLVIQASNAAKEFNSPQKTLMINISPPFWETWWFRIAAVMSIIAITYGIIRFRTQQKLRRQLERSEKERELAELRQQKSEIEMQALRAQMNPHFIFNSLNSINRFILQNDRLQASEYLTKFSKLVRMILHNSAESLISLESELESLELYMSLEAVRFDHHFAYKISVPNDLDAEVLKVPPLILQPFVENAIWHGLMHKEEKGHLDIEVSQEKESLLFKIADDGIGRKAAAELAGKSAKKHKSVGLKITADRIAMLQKSNGQESPVTFVDLAHADGSAAGTEVIIRMPVITSP